MLFSMDDSSIALWDPAMDDYNLINSKVKAAKYGKGIK